MKKIKLYVYDNAKKHEHDTNSSGMAAELYNTVPLSEKGILDHCVLVSPEEAEYFYMGQFSQDKRETLVAHPNNYKYFEGNEQRHILDIDGEGGFEASARPAIPPWLRKSIITTNGPLKKYSDIQFLFARPTFSHLLIDIIRNQKENFAFPKEKSFGLRIFLNHKVRAATVHALHNSDFKKEIHVNRKWQGLSPIGSKTQQDFVKTMLNNSISLCPRGSGIDSVRFWESCYFNRLPVVISDYDYFLFGEDHYDMSFCYRINNPNVNPSYIFDELKKIYETPIEDMEERAAKGKEYFETIVREYFADPTLYFLNWLEMKNEKK
jgi:hypothetical protein